MRKGVFSIVDNEPILTIKLDNFHIILSKGACLTDADLLDSSHLLRGIELSHENFLFEHFHHTEGERNTNCDRKAIGDGDYNEHHSDVDESSNLVNEIADACKAFSLIVLEDESVKDQSNEQNQKDQSG